MTDPILKKATELTKHTKPSYQPIKGRIAYVVSHGQSYASNGYAIRTHGIAKALNGHGLETLCFVRPGRPWDMGIAKNTVTPEMQVDGVRYIHSRWPGDKKPATEEQKFTATINRLVELFTVYRPQVVIAASNHEIALPALVAARQLGLPFQYEVRGFWEVSRASRDPAWENSPEYKEHYNRECWVISRADQLYTLNTQMKEELVARGAKPEQIDLVPNSISGMPRIVKQSNVRQQYGIPNDAYVLGYMGAITEYEGLDHLLEALKLLKKEKVYALIVGGYSPVNRLGRAKPEPIVQKLQKLAKSYGIHKQVIFTGRVDHDKLPEYFAAVDATVIPRAPLPVCELVSALKPLEYLSYGKPLIASNVAPQAEVLQQGRLGWLYEKGDSQSLADTVTALKLMPLEDLAERTEFGINAVKQKYQWGQSTAIIARRIEEPQVDYATASRWFYREGRLTDTLRALEGLQAQGVTFDKPKLDFKAFVEGMLRLKGGWPVPPRQPNPGLVTRRQHVLYCLHQSLPHATNGYSTRSHGVAVGLQDTGFTVRATTRPGFPWDSGAKGLSKGYHESEIEGVTYVACTGWSLSKTPLDYYLAEAADHYLREAQTSGAEIVVAASNHITALPGLMAARRLGLPFVYEVRGLWEVTQASTDPEWAGSERYELMRELEKQAAREADLVITLTEELAEELVSWDVPRERIEVVPNAVDAGRFRPTAPNTDVARSLKLKPNVPVIGYAGSAVAYEGLELLLEALAKLKVKGQEFSFVLVGDGKVMDTVKAKAKALGIEEECRFTGRVPFEEVPSYLSCMDIMPIPRLSSAVTEMVSALKPLEAMAMGKALVLSDVSPHTIMAGSNGERARLFQKNSADALSEALQALIDNPEERKRLGQAARTWIEKERNWNYVTRRYADALQRVRRQAENISSKTSYTDAKRLEHITLGLIADQFTTDTLASAVKVVPLSPDNWREELASQPIDAMFVESAWKGNDWQWHGKVGYYSDDEFAPLTELLAHCRKQGVPSLFWNKEDPVHFDRFREAASLCDHVFTTDSRRIIPYLATSGALSQTASSCPFYASPKIHNLLPSSREWQSTAAYGGTYYGKRYPERTEYMDKIMSAAAPLGLTIYDRQHSESESPYKYPGGLAGYVAGGLSYEEMIQAYKAHPVQINVNSVLDSPTMFSRRVVEAAACGSPLISGPALGMNRYLEGTGHIVRTESESAQALESLMHYPAYRWRIALNGARAIMRAHTTQYRLAQMLRTAGMVVQAPQLPDLQLVTDDITESAVERLLAQSLRPKRVLAIQWKPGTKNALETAGIVCASPQGHVTEEECLCLLASSRALEEMESDDFEDLAWPTFYAPHARIGFVRNESLNKDEWPGLALETSNIDVGLQLLRLPSGQSLCALNDWALSRRTLALHKPSHVHEQAPNVSPKRTVVIAGHDLKFIRPFYPYFAKAGIRVLLDFWTGHNQHNEAASKRLLSQADTVFCEWMMGNAIWYAKRKREGQKLVGRLHAQELRSPLFDKVPFELFDRVIFVGPHMLRNAQERNFSLKNNGVVIYNGVDTEAMQAVPCKFTNGKVLGLVGMVPQSKRLDRALDILKELRMVDQGYTLRVKGKRPEDYSWMVQRTEEMAWYEEQYQRIVEDPDLKDAVFFDQHGNDMPEWYSGIDYVLSVSDHESFHLAIAEGAAAGCTPVALAWEGAAEIYPSEWVYPDTKAAATSIMAGLGDEEKIREFAKETFDRELVAKQLCSCVSIIVETEFPTESKLERL